MFKFIQTEFLKLKRSKIFLLSLLGAIAPAFLYFLGILYQSKVHEDVFYFENVFNDILLYSLLLISVMLFSLIIAHLFSVEYRQHTLKSIFTAPVSKNKYVTGKFLMFLIWVLILVCVLFAVSIILGLIAGVHGLTFVVALSAFEKFLTGSLLLAVAMSPFAFLAVLFKNTVPVVIVGVVISLSNSLVYGQNISALSPWCAPILYSFNQLKELGYGIQTPMLIILFTCMVGLILTVGYYKVSDVKL